MIENCCATIRQLSTQRALELAVVPGHTAAVKVLVAAGADISWRGNVMSPLRYAVFYGRLDVVECLVEAGADVNEEDRVSLLWRRWTSRWSGVLTLTYGCARACECRMAKLCCRQLSRDSIVM